MKNKGKLCRCGKTIHPQRLKALPNTETCVDCSNVGKKGGVVVTKGEGEDTFNDIVIMDADQLSTYNKLKAEENKILGRPSSNNSLEE